MVELVESPQSLDGGNLVRVLDLSRSANPVHSPQHAFNSRKLLGRLLDDLLNRRTFDFTGHQVPYLV